MKLKPLFMLLTVMVFVVAAGAVSWSMKSLAEGVIEKWAPQFIIKQALYDKSRTLQPILRELALSRQLASSNVIKQWARYPHNNAFKDVALDELENYRQNFQDKSYFVALLENGHYYHNNASNEYRGSEFRYILDPSKPSDSWFYNIIEQKRDIHINVSPDVELGITKLWIDVLVKDGEDILGMVGTGLDLTSFLNSVVTEGEPGIDSFFVDHAGAIQLHSDSSLIDFGTVANGTETHKTIDLIFDDSKDRKRIYQAMNTLVNGEKKVSTVFVDHQDKRKLVGIVYLPEIDWFEVTLIDLSVFLPVSHFTSMVVLFVVTLLFALLLMNFVLTRLVLNPISQLDKAMGIFEQGKNPAKEMKLDGQGEISRLNNHFMQMADNVLQSRRDLENKIQERTAELERLVVIDPLTELYNRRGMTEQIIASMERAKRDHQPVGILWIDIDWFKNINDTYGHGAGDEALRVVADIIKSMTRPYDGAARWGGDEFLVLISNVKKEDLDHLAARLCHAVNRYPFTKGFQLSISIGGALHAEDRNIGILLQNADQALYQAKNNGRNGYVIYE